VTGYYLVLGFLAACCLWLFAKASNERDEFAGLVGHGIAALACLLAVGLGIQAGHAWLWVATSVIFAFNLVFLVRRIRQT
jgi:hypothetical protein